MKRRSLDFSRLLDYRCWLNESFNTFGLMNNSFSAIPAKKVKHKAKKKQKKIEKSKIEIEDISDGNL